MSSFTSTENVVESVERVADGATECIECCICYETLGSSNNCTTPCGHKFCFVCIAKCINNDFDCPYCRTKLVEKPVNVIDEEDDDGEEDEGSDYDTENDEDDESDDEYEKTKIETIAEKFAEKGYTLVDALSMLTGIYSKTEKYTNEYNLQMELDFDEILENSKSEAMEEFLFSQEDVNVLTL